MSEPLLDKLKRTSRLPTPPGTALEILRLCQQDDVSIYQLADTIAADPALSLRLLKYANSSLLGVQREITSIRDAVLLLGVRSVRLMALSFSLLGKDETACRGFDFTLFWSHSLATAVAARRLARAEQQISPEEAFATGLLARIGKLVFAIALPEEYAEILEAGGGTLGATGDAEKQAFGAAHWEVGADLIQQWGIPQRLAAIIRFHRDVPAIGDDPLAQRFACIIANAIAAAALLAAGSGDETMADTGAALVEAGLLTSLEQFAPMLGEMRAEFAELARTLNLRSDFQANIREIQDQAGQVLGELTLAAQLKSDPIAQETRGLKEKACTDVLTGVANRDAFNQHLIQAWEEAVRSRRPLGLVLLDIDHFKEFNETHGQRSGDAVLRAVGSSLAHCVRQIDFVARYGDEFAIILPRVDRLIVAQICVKIRKMIEMTGVDFEGAHHQVTGSIGAVVITRAGAPFTPQQLVEAADKQLCAARSKGRNCCSMRQIEHGAATRSRAVRARS